MKYKKGIIILLCCLLLSACGYCLFRRYVDILRREIRADIIWDIEDEYVNKSAFFKFDTINIAYQKLPYKSGKRCCEKLDSLTKALVPDEQTAIKIAIAVWKPQFGEEVIYRQPFKVALTEDSIWIVRGSLKPGWAGGVPYAEIRKEDGKVLAIGYDK